MTQLVRCQAKPHINVIIYYYSNPLLYVEVLPDNFLGIEPANKQRYHNFLLDE